MAKVYVDGKACEMPAGQNLLHACLSLGFNIPYFCWHPALGSVGACRQCAVKQYRDEGDTRGRIVMSCMTAVADKMRISIEDPEVKDFRARVIEWLMVNHPHDCPVCDEGGECHLQDMTLLTGHNYRRYRFRKRTYVNQNLGPFVTHEMNRCIQCYRCVRYYRNYAGGKDLNVFGAHDDVYFGREKDGKLESPFSGNLVEICPTGVFTDKTLSRHYTRKWDWQTAPSVCVHCSVGCNTIPAERYGEIRRIYNRYNSRVNRYFLCDRGRYGYEFINSPARIRQPILRDRILPQSSHAGHSDHLLSEDVVVRRCAELIQKSPGVIGIGSPRASLESNFALKKLVGSENFYLGMNDLEYDLTALMADILHRGVVSGESLSEMEECDACLILGEDVTNTAPLMALSLRQCAKRMPREEARKQGIAEWNDDAMRAYVQTRTGPFFVASPFATDLDEVAHSVFRGSPGDIADLGNAVAHELNPEQFPELSVAEEVGAIALRVAQALLKAEKPLIVSGFGCGSAGVVKSAANVAFALSGKVPGAKLAFTFPECNSHGVILLGGAKLSKAFSTIGGQCVIVLENDLYRRADTKSIEAFLAAAGSVVVLDYLENDTTARADIAFPAGSYAESDGTLVNHEGRAQRFYQVYQPEGCTIRESWRWLRDLMIQLGRLPDWEWPDYDSIVKDLCLASPLFKELSTLSPTAEFRIGDQKIAREHARYSGRTSMHANISVHEPQPPSDSDSALSFSMEGYQGIPPASLVPRFWVPRWNSVQAVTRFQEEVNGPLRGGPEGENLYRNESRSLTHFAPAEEDHLENQEGRFLILPTFYVFGSEELSFYTSGIAESAPGPRIALNPQDAQAIGLQQGSDASVSMDGIILRLSVDIHDEVPKGIAGIPSGLPWMKSVILPQWGQVEKAR